jgi:putative ATP-binding cassette transporter
MLDFFLACLLATLAGESAVAGPPTVDAASMLQTGVNVVRNDLDHAEDEGRMDALAAYGSELEKLVQKSERARLAKVTTADLSALRQSLAAITARLDAAAGVEPESDISAPGTTPAFRIAAEHGARVKMQELSEEHYLHRYDFDWKPSVDFEAWSGQRCRSDYGLSSGDPAYGFTSPRPGRYTTGPNQMNGYDFVPPRLPRRIENTNQSELSANGTNGTNENESGFGNLSAYDIIAGPSITGYARWLLLIVIIISIGFSVYMVVQHSPLRGSAIQYDPGTRRYNLGGGLTNRMIQIILPFWTDITPESNGSLFAFFLVCLNISAISFSYFYATMFLEIARLCDPLMYQVIVMAGVNGPQPVRLFLCLAGVFCFPLCSLVWRRQLKHRWIQWYSLGGMFWGMYTSGMVAYFASYISRAMTNITIGKAADVYWHWQRTFVPVSIAFSIVEGIAQMFFSIYLRVNWNRFLIKYMLEKWFHKRAYYILNSNAGKEDGMDNPDARIANDASAIVEISITLVCATLNVIKNLVVNYMIISTICPYWSMYALGTANIGMFVSIYFMWKYVLINHESERAGADFRFSLVNVRVQAEGIALLGGEATEKDAIFRRYDRQISWMFKSLRVGLLMSLWGTFFGQIVTLIPGLYLTRRYFQGNIDYGGLGQITGSLGGLLGSLSYFQNVELFSSVGTCFTRLGNMMQKIDDIHNEAEIKTTFTEAVTVELRNVTIYTPGHERCLMRYVSLQVGGPGSLGRRLLVVGRSGVGKSSLLRNISGLWHYGAGEIVRPTDDECMFLPQKPFLPLGSLRTQLRYPDVVLPEYTEASLFAPFGEKFDKKELAKDDGDLHSVLKLLRLQELPQRYEDGFDHVDDWQRLLSNGEAQRIQAARAILKKPKITCLDEATSSLSASDEEILYQKFIDMDMCFISIAHRMSIIKFHDMVLEVREDQSWQLYRAADFRVETEDSSPSSALQQAVPKTGEAI